MTGNVSYLQITKPDLNSLDDDDNDLSNIRSVRRLVELGFDPIAKQVELYRKLEAQTEYHEGMQTGTIAQLNGDGKQRRYSPMAHAAILSLMQKTGTDLTRYMYGRVPEGINFDTPVNQPFILALEDPSQNDLDTLPE